MKIKEEQRELQKYILNALPLARFLFSIQHFRGRLRNGMSLKTRHLDGWNLVADNAILPFCHSFILDTYTYSIYIELKYHIVDTTKHMNFFLSIPLKSLEIYILTKKLLFNLLSFCLVNFCLQMDQSNRF